MEVFDVLEMPLSCLAGHASLHLRVDEKRSRPASSMNADMMIGEVNFVDDVTAAGAGVSRARARANESEFE